MESIVIAEDSTLRICSGCHCAEITGGISSLTNAYLLMLLCSLFDPLYEYSQVEQTGQYQPTV